MTPAASLSGIEARPDQGDDGPGMRVGRTPARAAEPAAATMQATAANLENRGIDSSSEGSVGRPFAARGAALCLEDYHAASGRVRRGSRDRRRRPGVLYRAAEDPRACARSGPRRPRRSARTTPRARPGASPRPAAAVRRAAERSRGPRRVRTRSAVLRIRGARSRSTLAKSSYACGSPSTVSVGASPKEAKTSGPKVRISAIAPSSIRSTSIASALQARSPARRR